MAGLDPETKLQNLLLECLTHEEFVKTQFACKTSLISLIGTYSYYRLFNAFHPAKNIVVTAVGFGGMINIFATFSREIFTISNNDTPLANKLRLYHQNASYDNIFIPFFKGETFRTFRKRDAKSDNKEEGVNNNDN